MTNDAKHDADGAAGAEGTAGPMIGFWHAAALPEDIRPIRESWDRFGPADIRCFDDRSGERFIAEHYGPREVAAFRACALPAMRSDVFRVLAVLALGGFYCDMGVRLVASPSPFLPVPEGTLTLYRRWHGGINNGLFSAPAGHPVLRRIAERIVGNVERREGRNVMFITGPAVWREVSEDGAAAGVAVREHRAMVPSVFQYNNDLAHRAGSDHWSKRQGEVALFRDVA